MGKCKRRYIEIDEHFPSDTCRFIVNENSPYLYCSKLRRDLHTAYCSKHHGIVYRGIPAKPWELHKPEEKQREAA